jgi:hypothetical protein
MLTSGPMPLGLIPPDLAPSGQLPFGVATASAQTAPHSASGPSAATRAVPTPVPTHTAPAAKPAASTGSANPVAVPGMTTQDAGSSDDEQTPLDERLPVFAITGIEILHSKLKPGLDMVMVSGLTSSDGWSGAELVPLTRTVPPDNVLNLVLVASPPAESMAPTGYVPLFAMLPLPPDHPFKAIRVRGATNSVLLQDAAGSIEVAPPPEPCTVCIGRYFVAKGATAPNGVPEDKLLRQESLPPNARVIRPEDGIGDVQRNPDRLTIVIGEDGRVVDAIWE